MPAKKKTKNSPQAVVLDPELLALAEQIVKLKQLKKELSKKLPTPRPPKSPP